MNFIRRILNRIFPPKPHWQIIPLGSGTQVSCSQCGHEADYVPVYIPRDGDTLHGVAMGDIEMQDGYFMPGRCPNCGAFLHKEDVYYIADMEG